MTQLRRLKYLGARRLLVVLALCTLSEIAAAQRADSIINVLKTINSTVTTSPCSSAGAMAISNRAMNVFLADKTGYLSSFGDLSRYTNYVTFQSADGTLTVNHNFQKATGIDEPTRSLFAVGFKVNAADAYHAALSNVRYQNQLGVTLSQVWLGKVHTTVSGCDGSLNSDQKSFNQKAAMDALRLQMVASFEIEIRKKESEFNESLKVFDTSSIMQPTSKAASLQIVKANFYRHLAEEYAEKFASMQAELLTETKNFKIIRQNWTTLLAYVPLSFPSYDVTATLSAPIQRKHPYPVELSLTNTTLWEASKWGRLFFTIGAKLSANNGVTGMQLQRVDKGDYRNLGGTDTLRLAQLKNDRLYVGDYKNFITPAVHARIVYFPPDSHVGISFLAQQNFGDYNELSARLGIPIVLINSKKIPAANIEAQVNFFDLTNKVPFYTKGNKKAVSIAIGIPLSRLMF